MCTFRYNNDSDMYHKFKVWSDVAEIIFAIDLVANFFKNRHNIHQEHEQTKVTCKESYQNYLQGEFLWDFVPLVPLQLLTLKRDRQRIFYFIKMVRIRKTYQ